MEGKVLVIDNTMETMEMLKNILKDLNFEFYGVDDYDRTLALLRIHSFELVFLDMGFKDSERVLSRLRTDYPDMKVILTAENPSVETAILGIRAGVLDYLTKPFNFDEVRKSAGKAMVERAVNERTSLGPLIGASLKMQRLYSSILEAAAATDSTVSITGESGAGKELVAQTIHEYSSRREAEFVPVDCSAIPPNLFESELFGHVKGAFTDAIRDKLGSFRLADGGTIFFDEVAEITPENQVKLLRVLQEREIKPVGSDKTYNVNVRIITATNQDIQRAVIEKKMRPDFFHRIYVVTIQVPPLREHKEDIPLLVEHFIEKLNRRDKKKKRIDKDALDALCEYNWPGNIRELKNVIEKAYVTSTDNFVRYGGKGAPKFFSPLKATEKSWIYEAMEKTGGNRTEAARLLGIDRKTLYRKLLKYKAE